MATAPNQIGVADLTCIPTAEGWLYLAGVLDLHRRRIVDWAMGPTIDSALVLAALSLATLQRTPSPGLLCHSDRGVQYAAGNFHAALTAAPRPPMTSASCVGARGDTCCAATSRAERPSSCGPFTGNWCRWRKRSRT